MSYNENRPQLQWLEEFIHLVLTLVSEALGSLWRALFSRSVGTPTPEEQPGHVIPLEEDVGYTSTILDVLPRPTRGLRYDDPDQPQRPALPGKALTRDPGNAPWPGSPRQLGSTPDP